MGAIFASSLDSAYVTVLAVSNVKLKIKAYYYAKPTPMISVGTLKPKHNVDIPQVAFSNALSSQEKCFHLNFVEVITNGSIENMSALCQVITSALHRQEIIDLAKIKA